MFPNIVALNKKLYIVKKQVTIIYFIVLQKLSLNFKIEKWIAFDNPFDCKILFTLYINRMKQYNGEKAIISLTSWKARINTVSKTIYSLIKQCPGFHIVLVLSEEEFPQKEKELPDNLMLFVENDLIEILWVYKNTKSFKKVLPTMDKYRDVPVISADDDMIYVWNFVEDLYNHWLQNKDAIISHVKSFYKPPNPCGCAALYPPSCFEIFLTEFSKYKIKNNQDDCFYAKVCHKNEIKIICLYNYYPGFFHDEIEPINGGSSKILRWQKQQRYTDPRLNS